MSPRRKPYVSLIRQPWKELRADLRPAARGLLADLLVEADYKTGTIRGSLRWLSSELGVARNTLSSHLATLEANGLIHVTPGSNEDETTVITIVAFERLAGLRNEPADWLVGGSGGGLPGGIGGGSQVEPATSPPPAAIGASTSSTSSTSISSTPIAPNNGEAALTPFARNGFSTETPKSKVFDEEDDDETKKAKSRAAFEAMEIADAS